MTRPVAPSRWSAPVMVLHWLVAPAIIGMLGFGWWMTHAPLSAARRFEWTQVHKSAGIVVALLLIARVGWRLVATAPDWPDAPWRKTVAAITHAALYVLPLAMVISGWTMVSASPVPLPATLLGWALPPLTEPNILVYEAAKSVHAGLSKLLTLVVTLHVAAALWHTFVLRDRLLRRIGIGAESTRSAAEN